MDTERYMEAFLKRMKQNCPKCGSKNVDMDWKEGESGFVIVESICEDCQAEWEKHYKLVNEYVEPETEGGEGAE